MTAQAKQQSILRINKDKENPYVMVSKKVLNDERLSWKAKGLICYLLSLPDDWTIYLSELEKHSDKDGRESLASGIKELIALGYIVRESVRTDRGTYRACNYTVYESPQPVEVSEVPPTPQPSTNGKPDNGQQPEFRKPENGFPEFGKYVTSNTHFTNTHFTKKINNKKKNYTQKRTTSAINANASTKGSPKLGNKYESFYL